MNLGDLLKEALSDLKGDDGKTWEAFGPLSKEELDEWNTIKAEINVFKSKLDLMVAKKHLWWALVEKRTGKIDATMKVENEILMVQKENGETIVKG